MPPMDVFDSGRMALFADPTESGLRRVAARAITSARSWVNTPMLDLE